MSWPDDPAGANAPLVVGMPRLGGTAPAGTSRGWMQRLRLAGVFLPVVFVVALQLLRPVLIDERWPQQAQGDLVVSAATVLAAVVFGIVMFDLIQRSKAAMLRQNRELADVNRVLVEISQLDDPVRALATIVGLARTVPGVASAGLCLDRDVAASAAIGRGIAGVPTPDAPLCITEQGPAPCKRLPGLQPRADIPPDPVDPGPVAGTEPSTGCPAEAPVTNAGTMTITLHGPDRPYGQAWVALYPGARLDARDKAFLATLAELAVAALRHARLLDNERGAAVVAERSRIAREMHDSLAQVLGATHLRLRAVSTRSELADLPRLREEIDDVADICRDAYADVREAILGLRASTRTDVTFLENLDAYVRQFSRQSGIPTRLETDIDELAFVPQCEVQVLRVVQEALTNVRKHSGASRAVVRVRGGDPVTVLEVEDDGRGFDPATLTETGPEGLGLASMRERAALVDGRLSLESRPGEGTRVTVAVPRAMRLSGQRSPDGDSEHRTDDAGTGRLATAGSAAGGLPAAEPGAPRGGAADRLVNQPPAR